MAFNPVNPNVLKVISETSRVKLGHELAKVEKSGLNTLIKSISKNQEEAQPFYVLDLGVVVNLMEKWNQSLPNVKPFYAVKCNYEPALLIALATLEANFDCGSQAEIETILGLGISPERIVYANPCKCISHIKYAANVGVNLTTFDSKQEIDKIRKFHPKSVLLLRIKVPNDNTSWRSSGEKFGASPEEVIPLLEYADQAALKVVGISFHVGSKATESRVYRRAISAARFAFDAVCQLKMPPMRIINIGGGFKANPLFDEIAKTINDSIEEFFPNETQQLKVIAEPGRFLVETAFTLVTNVIGKRVRSEKIQYWIDDGNHGSFNVAVYDRSSMMFKALLRNENGEDPVTCLSTVFGPTCDPLDIVVNDCQLPELEVDDLIVFYNMGAYTTSPASKFNGFIRFAMPTYLVYSTPN